MALATCLPLAAAPQSSTHSAPLSIDGSPIPWSTYAGWLVHFRGRENIRAFALRQTLERTAAEEGIALRDEDLLAAIDAQIQTRVERAFEGDRSKWHAELALQQLTPDSYRSMRLDELRVELWTERLAQQRRQLDDATLERVWQSEYGPAGQTLHLSRLFLRVDVPEQPPGATRDEVLELGRKAREAVRERADALLAELRVGADFSSLVANHSNDDVSRARGGKLEATFQPENWPGIDGSELTTLEIGAVSEPLYSLGGWNLFRVDARETHPLAEVRDEVERIARAAPASGAESQDLNAELLGRLRLEVLPEIDRVVTAEEPRMERPVFSIDGEPVTREQYAQWMIPSRGRPFANAFVDRRVISRLAREAGVSLSRVEIDTRVIEDTERLIAIFHKGDRDDWLAGLREKNQTEADFMRKSKLRVSHSLLAEKLLLAKREITPELVARAWRERYGEGGRSLDVRFILRNIPAPEEGLLETEEELNRYIASESKLALEFLDKLRERALNGEDFSALARTYSDDPLTRDRGGRGAGRFELHTWPQEVQTLLRGLTPGQLAPPYDLGGQFFLFELAGIVEVPLEEVSEELKLQLQSERPSQVEVAGFVNQQARGHVVEILPGMFAR
jgi:PPIC-type PPIASE domain